MKIIADDKIPFLKGALDDIAEVIYLPGNTIGSADVKEADAIITRTRTKCNASILNESSVKAIASATIGYDHIDTAYCQQNNIAWSNSPGCNSGSVEQYIAAVLATLVVDKKWSLKGKKMAIIGVGNVGSKIVKLCDIFGIIPLMVDPPRARTEGSTDFISLDEAIKNADLITFHTPLIREGEDATFHMCDTVLISNMKKEAMVINTSRGEVVDNTAIREALIERKIRAAVIDVWENEPEIDLQLLDHTWIGTPHIAGYSLDGKAKGTEMSVQAISKHFNLGKDDWKASSIPLPKQANIKIDCGQMSTEQILSKAILHTYPILEDDRRLRENTAIFEKQRGDYPVRREFRAYNLTLKKASATQKAKLEALGFSITK